MILCKFAPCAHLLMAIMIEKFDQFKKFKFVILFMVYQLCNMTVGMSKVSRCRHLSNLQGNYIHSIRAEIIFKRIF